MADLHLHVKGIYFEQIKSGEKKEEYRETTDYWKKILSKAPFENVIIYNAYPERGDEKNIVRRPWKGMIKKSITHEHFGNVNKEVFAIKVNE